MRSISFRDLRLVPELAGYNEIQLLDLNRDELVYSILAKIGFDINKAVLYLASNHRDMQNKIAVGFRAVGEFQTNRDFVNSGMCDVYERIAISACSDRSLTRELLGLQNTGMDWSSLHTNLEDETEEDDEFSEEYVEETEQFISGQIAQLHELRDFARGPCFSKNGSPKTFKEYKFYREMIKNAPSEH